MTSIQKHYIGIDVAQATLEVAIIPTGETFTVDNNAKEHRKLARKFNKLALERIVLEATGGLERDVLRTLSDAGLPVACVNPTQSHRFSQVRGMRAKTDAMDAKMLAHMARDINPPVRELPSEQHDQLRALTTRRTQLVNMHAAEVHREKRANKVENKYIKRHLRYLKTDIKRIENEIIKAIESNETMKNKNNILCSVPGIGQTIAAVLISELPELGQITNKQIASLVGVAPFAKDSGKKKGYRSCKGGRAPARKALYMAALVGMTHNQTIKAFYENMDKKGKPGKVALNACMRKLITYCNTMIANNQMWKEPIKA